MRDLLGGDEGVWEEAKRTVLNAHYTDPQVVEAMWDAARRLGFREGRVLEPGCGAGTFLAYAPEGARLVGVEHDRTTAAIARALYPDAEIYAGGFEDFDARTPFDLVIGNVPFAKVAPYDKRYNRGNHSLHNYFLVKSLRLLRPGGMLLALTSRYTLDSRNPAARREMAQYGDLVGALRLPGGAMRRIAGTDAIIDLLILRRRAPGQEPAGVAGWERAVGVELPDEGGGRASLVMNAYLAENPELVLGEPVVGQSMYRDGDLLVRGDLENLGSYVEKALVRMVGSTNLRYQPPAIDIVSGQGRAPSLRVGDTELAGDRITPLRRKSFVASRTGVLYRHEHGELVRAEVPRSATEEVRRLIELRDTTVNLLHLESNDAPDTEIAATRTRLAGLYERYVRQWGPLNRVSWQRTGRTDPASGEEIRRRVPARLGGFRHDPEWTTLAAIEVYDEDTGVATPGLIQRQRVVHPPAQRFGADTPDEAIAISLDEIGHVDLERVAELLGVDEDAARSEIEPFVFEAPDTGQLVPAEDYLSGDVRAKLAAAQRAAATHERFTVNVDALARVQPPQIAPGDIVVRPGVPWVPARDIQAFAIQELGLTAVDVAYIPSLGHWAVDVPNHARRSGYAINNEWATKRVTVQALLKACLNQRLVRVYDEHDDGRVLNVAETTMAREKQEQIAERFSHWIWTDPDRSARLTERYNNLFNSYVAPDYKGDHLTFPGLTEGFTPHAHQRAAVARILREGRVLLGHAVGAGKTATMVIAGMEMRRLGLVNRPAYVVPNHMLEQFSREFLQLYPQARVLVTTKDLTGKAGRQEFVARCATGEWDAVVITHSAFERLPMREATYKQYLAHRTAELQEALEQAKASQQASGNDSGRDYTVKRMQAARDRQEEQLKKLIDASSKDDGVCLEESGIDYLFIDELHLYKNKAIATSVEGVASAGSKRATDLDSKLWYLRQRNGARSLTGATATPIANSIAEAWVMQTYLQPDVLVAAGLDKFDAWAATFGRQVAAVELAPDGGSYRVASRLSRYQNVPELIAQFRRTTDIKVREDLDLKLPTIAGDAPEVVVVPASDGLTDYVNSLVDRADAIRSGAVEPDEDNMLKVTSDGRHAALDLRLVGKAPDPEGGKITVAARRIARIYHDTRHNAYLDTRGQPAPRTGAFQIVFCDLSTPKGDGTWNAYDELKDQLIAEGLPADEIAFIHDAHNDEARAMLFARCREGQVAVLVGSTAKMGVGTNIHARLIAIHHLDAPWRPADIEQRDGRGVRQGNQNDQIQIIRYATRGSFDTYMWQTLERKAGFTGQVMRGEGIGRDLDDVGDAVLSYSEVKALASGNPLVIEQAGVQADLAKYERLEHAHIQQQREFEATARRRREDATRQRQRAEALRQAISQRQDTGGDKFTMTIAGQTYTKRTDAGKALHAQIETALHKLAPSQDTTAKVDAGLVGQLAGFDVTLMAFRFRQNHEVELTVCLGDGIDAAIKLTQDELQGRKANLVQRLEHPIRRLDQNLEDNLKLAIENDNEAEALEARCHQPFPQRERLTELRQRHQEILDQLNAEAQEATNDADIKPDDQEEDIQGDPPGPDHPLPSSGAERLDDLKRNPERPEPDDPSPEL